GPPAKLQVLLPGETPKPNTVLGKEGTPEKQIAGKLFQVTVNITDVLWNVNTSAGATVRIETTDPWDIEPPDQPTSGGQAVFNLTLVTANQPKATWPFWENYATHQVKAYDVGLVYSTGTSSNFYVEPSSRTQWQVILPGEGAQPGKWDNGINPAPFGKNGTPTVQTAGIAFASVTIRGVDNYYNIVTTAPSVTFTVRTEDPYDTNDPISGTLDQGLGVLVNLVNMQTSSTWTVTAEGSGLILGRSSKVYIKPNVPTRLQVLAPGEEPEPGRTATRGKKDSLPTDKTAGVSFNVSVRSCDNWYNPTSSQAVCIITTNDPWDVEPS
ncbi:MAG: hypothetical protein QME68_08905, partial [Elusimicrobiota bacterium]|nr:hypothetical protein [Elusimicrobiota bacterium]